MKKVSTVTAKQSGNFSQPTLTIGLDLGDRNSTVCWISPAKSLHPSRVVLETGTHSPWISRLVAHLNSA